MSNNWKYSSLTQRERLKMISDGNSDVYNTEKEKNRKYKNQLSQNGLDTSNVDLWDSAIDNAYYKATDPHRVADRGQPRFLSYRTSMLINEYKKQVKNLSKIANQSINEAKNNAYNSTLSLKEWLANNGYSQEGSYAKKEFSNISNNLSKTLKKINEEYLAGVKYAGERLRSQM